MCYTEFRCVPSTFIWTHTFSVMPSSLWRGLYGALIDHNMNWLVITGPLLLPMSLWHHRSACSAVNQEVGGLSPPRDVLHSCVSNCILPYCVLKFFKLSLLSILHTHWLCARILRVLFCPKSHTVSGVLTGHEDMMSTSSSMRSCDRLAAHEPLIPPSFAHEFPKNYESFNKYISDQLISLYIM